MTERWKWWCEACGTLTDDSKECDCTNYGNAEHQRLHPYPFSDSDGERNAGMAKIRLGYEETSGNGETGDGK